MKTGLLGILLFLTANLALAGVPTDVLKEGDLIFHQSKSAQSEAIREATGSPWSHVGVVILDHNQWKVAEAIGPVVKTPIEQFIARGRGERFILRRPKNSQAAAQVTKALARYLGIRYDVYFEWSNDLIYCSELVWKAYHDVGADLSQPTQFKDLHLDGPLVTKLIKDRYQQAGKKLNLEEPIVTPVALFESQELTTVYDSATRGLQQPGMTWDSLFWPVLREE